jgi:ribosomal protein L29
MSKASNLRDQSIEELEMNLENARKDLFTLRCEFSQNTQWEKPHRLPQKRREVARLLTILHEKQSASEKSAI